jgi:hypothetical protein
MAGGGRLLCSHLVRLSVEGSGRDPEWGNLEEIDAFGGVVGAQQAWPTQMEIRIEAEGFQAPAYVRSCRARESDFELAVEFTEGFRWSVEDWRPDHAYEAPARARAAETG